MSDATTRLQLPFLLPAQAQKHVTLNQSLLRLDALVQTSVLSATTLAQPAAPADGDIYLLPAGKSGAAWGAMSNLALAYWRDGVWEQLTPRDGWTVYVVDTDTHLVRAGAAWRPFMPAGAARGFRNRLVNSAFAFNQRAATTAADDAYCFDRFYVLCDGGAVTIGALTDPESGRLCGLRLTQPDAGAKRIGLAQIVESADIRDLRSAAVAMAARIRCSSSQAIRMAILEHTGTADAVTSDVVNAWSSGAYTPGNFFIAGVNVIALGVTTPSAATWTDMPAITGAFGAAMTNAIVLVWTEGALAQNGTLDIDQIQLEPGRLCGPFARRPDTEELLLCQRFYWRWGHENADAGTGFRMFGHGKASVYEGQTVRHPVRMRAVPTLSKVGTWSVTNCGQPALSDPSTQSFTIFVQVTADGSFDFFPSGSGDYIEASAEL